MSKPQLTRTHSVKRKRCELPAYLKDAIKQLRQVTDRLTSSIDELPYHVNALVDTLQMQTAVIEALASYQRGLLCDGKTSKETLITSVSEKSPIHGNPETPWDDAQELPQAEHSLTSYSSRISADCSILCESSCLKEAVPTQMVPARTVKLNSPSGYSRKHLSQIPEIVLMPPSPSTSSPQSNPPHCSLQAEHCIATPPCSSCDTWPWHLTNHPDPRDSDLRFESQVQDATFSLSTNIKKGKRTPIGPLAGCTFNLYSSDYRRHYCNHDRPDRQSLRVYSKSKTWESDFAGVPATGLGEVAMDLSVYPDCLLIVKPFKVPKHADWKWYTVDAIGVNANPTTIEIMFLGNGFLKTRVMLSQLLGERLMNEQETDCLIEFAGIWSPN